MPFHRPQRRSPSPQSGLIKSPLPQILLQIIIFLFLIFPLAILSNTLSPRILLILTLLILLNLLVLLDVTLVLFIILLVLVVLVLFFLCLVEQPTHHVGLFA